MMKQITHPSIQAEKKRILRPSINWSVSSPMFLQNQTTLDSPQRHLQTFSLIRKQPKKWKPKIYSPKISSSPYQRQTTTLGQQEFSRKNQRSTTNWSLLKMLDAKKPTASNSISSTKKIGGENSQKASPIPSMHFTLQTPSAICV